MVHATGSEPGCGFDPYLPYSEDNYPPESEQLEFFHYALLEAFQPAADSRIRHLDGPLNGAFKTTLAEFHLRLSGCTPPLEPRHVVPPAYLDSVTSREIDKMDSLGLLTIADMRSMKLRMLGSLAAERLLPILERQSLPPGLLDVPPYSKQGHNGTTLVSMQACTNACFRMVFGGITGWVPDEMIVAQQLQQHTGSSIVDDDVYHHLLMSDIVSEISEKKVTVVAMTGADLETIGKLASGMKAKQADAQVFTVVSLGSTTTSRDVWHASVLLSATEEEVICHDPSISSGRPNRRFSKEVFAGRWAIGLNRAQIVLVR